MARVTEQSGDQTASDQSNKAEELLGTVRREKAFAGQKLTQKASALFCQQPEVKSKSQVVRGEVIPTTKAELNQVSELKHMAKKRFSIRILDSGMIKDIAKSLGIKSLIRVRSGTGGYEGSVTPNLSVQVVNKDPKQAVKDADTLSDAMSYVFQQDATPRTKGLTSQTT